MYAKKLLALLREKLKEDRDDDCIETDWEFQGYFLLSEPKQTKENPWENYESLSYKYGISKRNELGGWLSLFVTRVHNNKVKDDIESYHDFYLTDCPWPEEIPEEVLVFLREIGVPC